MKKYLVFLFFLVANHNIAQSKREKILHLNRHVDSLSEVITAERRNHEQRETDCNLKLSRLSVKNEEIIELNRKLVGNLETNKQEIKNLQDALRKVKDSIANQALEKAEETKSTGSLSSAIFNTIKKENINQYSYDSVAAYINLIPNPILYKEINGSGEEVYFEKKINNKVVFRGTASSGCGDCATYALNYFTIDGFLFLQCYYSGCDLGLIDSNVNGVFDVIKIKYFGKDEFPVNRQQKVD